MRSLLLLTFLAVLAACDSSGSGGGGSAAQPAALAGPPGATPGVDGVYVIGSSFSWDARPSELDNDPEWQIYCAKPLDFIYWNPDAHCQPDSVPWPDVLDPPAVPYDYVSFQPIPGDGITQEQDVSHITEWLSNLPLTTVGVIQATWPVPSRWELDLHQPDADHTFTNYSIDYYYDLLDRLVEANPGRAFLLTRSNEMLDYILHDPNAPLAFAELFRDASGHMSRDFGYYLQHNALRQAMGQETGVDPTLDGVDPVVGAYLDAVVELHRPW